jgi:hypothetical protein
MTQEPPRYSFKAYWEADGRIGVVACIERPDGGVHLLNAIIDPPQRTWVGLTDEQMLECNMDGDFVVDREIAKLNVQAKLKDKNT